MTAPDPCCFSWDAWPSAVQQDGISFKRRGYHCIDQRIETVAGARRALGKKTGRRQPGNRVYLQKIKVFAMGENKVHAREIPATAFLEYTNRSLLQCPRQGFRKL